MSPRRSSTAGGRRHDGPVHRRPSRRGRGRADLRRAADRPVDGLIAIGTSGHIRRAGPHGRSATISSASRFSGSMTRTSRSTAPGNVWKPLRRDGVRVARGTVARLMRAMGLAGAVRGRAWVTTTHAGEGGRPVDLVDRRFVATRPNQRWVSDFTCVATWGGCVYVAFVIDVCARRMVGWRVSASMRTDCVLDALGAGDRRPPGRRPHRPRTSQ